jgi:hypothetical protein
VTRPEIARQLQRPLVRLKGSAAAAVRVKESWRVFPQILDVQSDSRSFISS